MCDLISLCVISEKRENTHMVIRLSIIMNDTVCVLVKECHVHVLVTNFAQINMHIVYMYMYMSCTFSL